MAKAPGLVLDAAGLIALARLGVLQSVAAEFGRLVVPAAVMQEAAVGDRPGARAIRAARDAGRLSVASSPTGSELPLLGPGEAAVIAVASERQLPALLDDREARAAAAAAAVPVIGTLAVLVALKKTGRIRRLASLIERLEEFGFRMTSDLRAAALRAAGEPTFRRSAREP